MKKALLGISMCCLLGLGLRAQTLIDNYRFSTRIDSTAWLDITGVDSTLVATTNSGLITFGRSVVTEIGFTFPFGSTAYTQFSVNLNGILRLGSSAVWPHYDSNPLTRSTNMPGVNAFGFRGVMDSTCHLRYATLGAEGSRVLVVDARIKVYNSDSSYVSYQQQLYEATGEVRIVYGPSERTDMVPATQPGLARTTSDIIFIDHATYSVRRFANSSVPTNEAGVWPQLWRCYCFVPDMATCPYPSAVTATSTLPDSVRLEWVGVSGSTAWRIAIPLGGIDTVIADTFFTIGGLEPSTVYTGTLQTFCGVDSSLRQRTFSFTTGCGTIHLLPWSDNFQAGRTDECWSKPYKSYSNRWQRMSTSNNYYMRTGYGSPSTVFNDWLISPPVVLPDTVGLLLKWWFKNEKSNGITPKVRVRLLVCDSTDAVDTTATWATLDTVEDYEQNFQLHRTKLDEWAGQRVRVAFQRFGTGGSYAYIDDVSIEIKPQPLLDLQAPAQVYAGDTTVVVTQLIEGVLSHPQYQWSSSMLDRGQALILRDDDTLKIVYLSGGRDTATVTLTTDFGTATATTMLDVEPPQLTLAAPDSAEVGDTISLSALMQHGYSTGMTVVWHSTMADCGNATLAYDSLQATLVYLAEGFDTISVTTHGLYGNGIATATIRVPDPLRFYKPHNSIIADATLVQAFDTVGFKVMLTSGSTNGLQHNWSSVMANRSEAVIFASSTSDSISIVYLAGGVDTVTVHTVNTYGQCGDTLALVVCDSVRFFPWRANFATEINCWHTTFNDNNSSNRPWRLSGSSALIGDPNSIYDPTGALITPPILLPADSMLSLQWTARGYANYWIKISSTGDLDTSSFVPLMLDRVTENTVTRHIDLGDYVGQTVRIGIFKEITSYLYGAYLYIDSLAILPLYAPKISVSGTKHALADSIGAQVSATLTQGLDSMLYYVWSSTMTDRGVATYISSGNTAHFYYSTGGTDTITVVAVNLFGTDTVHYILGVGNCGTVAAEDYTNGFASKLDCWHQPSNCSWKSDLSGIAYSNFSNQHIHNMMMSQGVSIPGGANDSVVLEWKVNSTGVSITHNYIILATTGDYTDLSTYDTLLADTVNLTGEIIRRVGLGRYADSVVHFMLLHDPNALSNYAADTRGLVIKNLCVRDLRKPVVRIEAPSVAHSGESTLVMARLSEGSSVGLSFTWHSAMATSGQATMTTAGDSLHIVYSISGTDTITVIATNSYGHDTVMATITVQSCDSIDSLPWYPNICYGDIPCWRTFNFTHSSNSNWQYYSGGIRSSSSSTNTEANNWLVTPAIDLPIMLDGSVLRWTLRAPTQTIDHVIYRSYMEVLLTTGDATDTSTYSHVLFSDYLNGQRTYEVTLDSFAGQTVHIAFVRRQGNGNYISLDSVSISNGGAPQIAITPPTALNVGENCRFTAHMLYGAHAGLTYTWHSTMAVAGLATMTAVADTMHITYLSDGTDTVTVIASNSFGDDTVAVVMPVHNCPPVVLPWTEDFEDSATTVCWSTFAYHYNNYSEYERMAGSWQRGGDSTNHNMRSNILAYDYLVSPAIMLPTLPNNTDIILEWEQNAYHNIPVIVVVSPTGYYDGEENFTDTLCNYNTSGNHRVSLRNYCGSTVRLAFIASYSGLSTLLLDNVSISFEIDTLTVWHTVTVICDSTKGTVVGGGIYTDSSLVSLTATPFDGFRFMGWSDGDTNAIRSLLLVSDTTLTAFFDSTPVVPDTVWHTVTVICDSTKGTVAGGGIYTDSSLVSLTATPFDGFRFMGWSDGDTNAIRSLLLVSDTTLTAFFDSTPVVPDTVWRTLTVTTNVEGACETYGSGRYVDSSTVEIGFRVLDTLPEGGRWQFLGWDDGPTETPRQILVASDTTIVALFEWVPDSVGIEEIENSKLEIEIYPNPSRGDVTIDITQAIGQSANQTITITVLDLTGRTVIPPTPIVSSLIIPRSSLPSGTYFVRVTTPSGPTTKKLLLQ